MAGYKIIKAATTMIYKILVAGYDISYYDDYSFYGNSFSATGITASSQTRGLQTGSRVNVLGTSTMLLSTNYYDDEGRLLQSKSDNHLGGTDLVTNSWNFAGELTASSRVHVANSATTTIANRYEYDHTGRKLSTYQSMNSDAEVQISSNNYNEIGQLSSKCLHNNQQSTDYTYTPRGWLKTSTSTQFSQELKYENGTSPQYNGNIANQVFSNGGSSNTFTYSYDLLNRLSSATATGMSEVLSYDNMGNILTLNRNSAGASTYSYSGNRLSSISGSSVSTATNYVYDGNGNATTDGRNNRTITYNHLNLPVTVSGSPALTYTYDAGGNKLSRVSGSNTRHYISGIEYDGSSIELIHTEEGIARRSGSSYSYEYNLRDHLGNTRTTFYRNPSTGNIEVLQRDDYYAFGKRKIVLAGSNDNKYLYNGKELQEELGQSCDMIFEMVCLYILSQVLSALAATQDLRQQ